MNISVFGLGYVGSVCCGAFCREGHRVIGVDVNRMKVDCINSGRSPIAESGLNELLQVAGAAGRLSATTSVQEAVAQSDISLICVGTPSRADGSLDTTYVKRVTEQIIEALAKSAKEHILLYRSTMLPGTFENVINPMLSSRAGITAEKIRIAYNPEFIREGTAIEDFYNPAKTVIGMDEQDEQTIALLLDLYSFVSGEKQITDIPTAQMIKYADNTFHALKITFANEIGAACRCLGIDSHHVMRVFCQDTKLNISTRYLTPGKPYGGSCLPKDVQAFSKFSENFDYSLSMIQGIETSNENQKDFLNRWISSFQKNKIGIIGLTFKADTDDIRNSPAVTIARATHNSQQKVLVYDPNLDSDLLTGANLDFINTELPELNDILCNDLQELGKQVELFVIFNNYPGVEEWLVANCSDKIILDLVRLGPAVERLPHYHGLYW